MREKCLLGISILSLVACSYYGHNGEASYLTSTNGPSLIIRKPLTEINSSHFYYLPEQNQNAQVSIVPPT